MQEFRVARGAGWFLTPLNRGHFELPPKSFKIYGILDGRNIILVGNQEFHKF